MTGSVYSHKATLNNGEEHSLDSYKGKVLLIVNTASRCGFTPQYQGLEALYDKYKDKGLEILAFPCDQFGHQEPGDDTEIKQFCDMNYSINFPLFKKIEVNGDNAHPLYQYLKAAAPGFLGSKGIKWNFTKFLINKDGEVVRRYAPTTKPEDLDTTISALLT